MRFFQTKAYKVIMNYVYGWGAAVVILGALFKIMHLKGAGWMLIIGMSVEAIIFFLSAFEPALEHYDWSRVFPALGKGHKELEDGDANGVQMPLGMAAGAGAVSSPATVTGKIDLGLEAEDLTKLKEGINKIAVTADNFADMVEKTPDVAQQVNAVSASFEELEQHTREMSKALQHSAEGFSTGCNEVNKILLQSAQELTARVKENCERLADSMGASASGFCALGKLMEDQLQQLQTNTGNYTQQLAGMNKNIGALNALYEIQIGETRSCLDTFRGMQGNMGEMLEHVAVSLDSAKLFKKESEQLANNVASLNAVYGNMLSVVNNN